MVTEEVGSVADVYGIPSTEVYTMMSWLHERPMEEHVAVEFWSGPGPPEKCLQMLSLQFSKSVDGCKLILSTRRPEVSSTRSQGKPKMAVRIAGGSEVCLSGCSSITECTRIMGPAPPERQNIYNSSNTGDTPLVLELWVSEVRHYLEIFQSRQN